MSLSVLMKLYNNKYEALKVAKWLKKNLNKSPKTAEELKEDITQFENNLNEDLLLNRNKCPHCKIEMATLNNKATVECPKCGLADTKLLMKDFIVVKWKFKRLIVRTYELSVKKKTTISCFVYYKVVI